MAADTWYSTQETAYALMAVAAYYGGSPAKPFRFKLGWEGETPREVEAAVPFFQQAYSPFTAMERKLRVVNPGEGRLYVTATIAGIPAAGAEKAHENNLRLEVAYQDMSGEALDTARLAQGSDLQVKISVTNLSKSLAEQPGPDPHRSRRLPDRQSRACSPTSRPAATTTTRTSATTASTPISAWTPAPRRPSRRCSTPRTAAASTCRGSAWNRCTIRPFTPTATGRWVEIAR